MFIIPSTVIYDPAMLCQFILSFFAGIPMYIIPSTVIYDPAMLCQFIHDNKITRILFTPSLLEAVLNTADLNLQDLLQTLR